MYENLAILSRRRADLLRGRRARGAILAERADSVQRRGPVARPDGPRRAGASAHRSRPQDPGRDGACDSAVHRRGACRAGRRPTHRGSAGTATPDRPALDHLARLPPGSRRLPRAPGAGNRAAGCPARAHRCCARRTRCRQCGCARGHPRSPQPGKRAERRDLRAGDHHPARFRDRH
jgi:hypothetical protein